MNFYKNVIEIDKIISNKEITNNIISQLKSYLKKWSLANYFWRENNNAKWFPALSENSFFDILNEKTKSNNELYITQTFVSDFLKIASKDYPNEIVSLIKKTKTDNNRVIWNFVTIGYNIDAKYTAELIPQVKRWLDTDYLSSTNFGPEIIKWFNHLVNGNELDSTLKLLEILTQPKIQPPAQERDKKLEVLFGKEKSKAIPPIESYWYEQLLSQGIKSLIDAKPLPCAQIIKRSLDKAIKVEHGSKYDLSYIWRPAVERHSQNDLYDIKSMFTTVIRDSLEIASKKEKELTHAFVLGGLLENNYSIYRRLSIHIMRLNFASYRKEVYKLLLDKDIYEDSNLFHEFYLLLKEKYPLFSKKYKKIVYTTITGIESFLHESTKELQEKQKKYFWYERLSFISEHLEDEEKNFYESLKGEFKEDKIRDTSFWSESYIGEKSPVSVGELEKMKDDELWKYLENYKPASKSFDSPSIEGLARIFAEAFKRNPERFLSTNLSIFIMLKPTYSYWFIDKLTEHWRNGIYFDKINEVLDICSELAKLDNIQYDPSADIMVNFDGVRKRIIDLIQAAIKTNQKTFPLEYKDKIWHIISFLVIYKSRGKKENVTDGYDPITSAINSVNGMAMHAVIDYGLWYAYQTKDAVINKKSPNRLKDEKRVINLLEEKLDKTIDSDLGVHSVFGLLLPNLAYLNKKWVERNLNRIFPETEKVYWNAAWLGYIQGARFYKDLFKMLESQFSVAVNKFAKGEKIFAGSISGRPEESLGEYLVIANIHNLDDIKNQNSLLRKYVLASDHKTMSHLTQYIANLAKDEFIFEQFTDFWLKAKELWLMRITYAEQSETNNNSQDDSQRDWEFANILRWLEHLPQTVTLIELESLLIKTIAINKKGWQLPTFIEYLEKHSNNYPIIAMNLLKQLSKTDTPNYFYHGTEEKLKTILSNAISTGNIPASQMIENFMNFLGEQGNYYFKDMWKENFNNKFYVNNITESDIKRNRIRILKDQKPYFPREITNEKNTFHLVFFYEENKYRAKYRIGSIDNKLRSGELSFSKSDYKAIIGTNPKKIMIEVLSKDEAYRIINL